MLPIHPNPKVRTKCLQAAKKHGAHDSIRVASCVVTAYANQQRDRLGTIMALDELIASVKKWQPKLFV